MRSSISLWDKGLGTALHRANENDCSSARTPEPDPGESLQAAHQGDKKLGRNRSTVRSPEDEAAFHDFGNAMVKNSDPQL
jgi:hypothetical protein